MTARLHRRIAELEREVEAERLRAEASLDLAEAAVLEVKELREELAKYERLGGLVRDEVSRSRRQPKVGESERKVLSRGIARARLARKNLSPEARERFIARALAEGAISLDEANEYRRGSKPKR